MQRNEMKIRMLAAAGAVTIVAGAILGLGSYSNAKYQAVAFAAQPATELVQLAIESARIEVVGTRVARTRTAAHVPVASVPRPQS